MLYKKFSFFRMFVYIVYFFIFFLDLVQYRYVYMFDKKKNILYLNLIRASEGKAGFFFIYWNYMIILITAAFKFQLI